PVMFAMALAITGNPVRTLAMYVAGYVLWAGIGAVALRKWRLVFMAPALIAVDWVQRVNFVHAFCKTVRQPRVESCTWSSPTRYTNAAAEPTALAA
ncbi:MAG: hypothetical protein U0W40_19910, partial [Acidimicrobiia bacterium]